MLMVQLIVHAFSASSTYLHIVTQVNSLKALLHQHLHNLDLTSFMSLIFGL